MGYKSKSGRRPDEYASKSAHSHVIKDPGVQAFLSQCNLPRRAEDVSFEPESLIPYIPVADNPIHYFIAVDGGYSEVAVQTEFPSATICFFQFGALVFSLDDLRGVANQRFIDPDDMAKLKRINRLEFTLPVRNVTLKTQSTLTNSIRRTVYDFFQRKIEDLSLMDTLLWFIFQEYSPNYTSWILATCPTCHETRIPLQRSTMARDYTFACTHCGGLIYLTDVFRLHETVDDELGAGDILGYVTTTIEQIMVIHLIRAILRTKPALLKQILFIKDGPLAFFGQTANMHKPMRALVKFLFDHHALYLAGLEKSGPFVEHADEIAAKLIPGSILILDNDYIYRYVLPRKADSTSPYGESTYYGNKVIFKTQAGSMYVVSVPTTSLMPYPKENDLYNLHPILTNVEMLKSDMYDNALFPVALVNKLVSLSDHPSSKILQKFAMESIGH